MRLLEQRQSLAKQAQPGGPSSLAGGRPQSGPCIVCVDIPDPDNFLMVLRVLRDHRDHHVDIVISPRPVSFAAIPYGPAFLEMTRREENPVPVPIALGRVTPERQLEIRSNPNVRDSEKAWFYVDEDLTKPEVKEDTNIYLEVSKFRLITFLDNHGISRSRYSLYREANLDSAKTIVPGMHHSFHKPDFAFDFKDMFFYGSEKAAQIAGLTGSDAQRFDAMCKAAIKASDIPQTPDGTKAAALRSSALFEAAVTKEKDDPDGYMLSQKRREDTRLLCNVYRQLKAKECSTLTFGSIESLVKKYRGTNIKPLLYLGGPFTEALKIIKALKGPRIGPIIAMAGATHGNSNIFANQFNILIDTASALEMLWMAQAKEIDLTLLPTECVKGTAYTLSWTDFEQKVAPWSPHTSDLYHQWAPNSPVNLFDLLAAMSVTTDLYKGMQCYVTYEESRDAHRKGQFVFKKGDDVASSGPGLKMFWNEPSITEVRDQDGKAKEEVSFAVNTHMNNMTDIYFKEIEWTLQRLNS
ncbi:hypothetical protein DL766_004889 [Monosporascus sp. MC13-8B]|uniref:Inosine/uridine-preferring nucleoside hydrolase domain-containing protein n=1 Tax=Monosporascus cannonballus TaxID=155416 RepID=A0ABY0GW30_9PEZI|nr:hypothetical protein DL762_008571 [Monosporascus cannonballus]RYP00223.1 hypothetical protein DL763_000992 [Monosporascus cannonballus]RYP30411.1 hypothetical protein DL766_004889 [Monosporascus sp. MC13-8B]